MEAAEGSVRRDEGVKPYNARVAAWDEGNLIQGSDGELAHGELAHGGARRVCTLLSLL